MRGASARSSHAEAGGDTALHLLLRFPAKERVLPYDQATRRVRGGRVSDRYSALSVV